MVQFSDEHRWHSIKRRATFLRNRFEGLQRTEMRCGKNHCRTMCHTSKVSDDHAEAMIKWHRNANPVMACEAQPFSNTVSVVQNIMVREHRALGKTGRARGVVDVDNLSKVQSGLAFH